MSPTAKRTAIWASIVLAALALLFVMGFRQVTGCVDSAEAGASQCQTHWEWRLW